MRRVHGRGDIFLRKQPRKLNLDVWLTRGRRLLARFWGRGYEVDEESYEVFGFSAPRGTG